jgi:hypothetical protein
MTIARLPIPKRLTILMLALTALTVPASATIQFSYCSSGCSSTGGSYSAWDTATGSAGLVFSGSPITFSAGGLSSGVYTDGTGTVFTGYSNATNTDSLTLSGTALAQTTKGANSGIEITLPSGTYAFAMILTTVSGFGSPYVELNDRILSNSNYSMSIPSGGTQEFFGFLSDTAITSVYVGNLDNLSGNVQINSFELGAPTPTPEVSSLVSIGTGLILCGFLLRRRRIQKPDRSLA